MTTGFLRVSGVSIVDESDTPIVLRGAGLGGWMNMENFITGFPGHESEHRAAMLAVLGQERYDFFFDRFLEYFFGEEDALFFRSVGLNCLRVGFNYRHFEDDMNPRVLKEGGFKHLDRVVDICAHHGKYTILDMHALPGGQNPDWHSDNVTNHASFWDHRDFQDRAIWLWRCIAARYKDNPWVAGYNVVNEPCDPLHYRLPAFYERAEREIRKVDPKHMLFLDGNTFAMEWRHFESVLPNCVYALHDYASMGFPKGERFTGAAEQTATLERQFARKADFMRAHGVPLWNGEFGPVYADGTLDSDADATNDARYALLAAQLRIYEGFAQPVHWTIWLYKDIGYQGMVHARRDSAYMRLIAPFQARKRDLQLDAWGRRASPAIDALITPLVDFIREQLPASDGQYPTPWATERQLVRLVNQMWMARCAQEEFAALFGGKTEGELDELARSFCFAECRQREGLNKVLKEHTGGRVGN